NAKCKLGPDNSNGSVVAGLHFFAGNCASGRRFVSQGRWRSWGYGGGEGSSSVVVLAARSCLDGCPGGALGRTGGWGGHISTPWDLRRLDCRSGFGLSRGTCEAAVLCESGDNH